MSAPPTTSSLITQQINELQKVIVAQQNDLKNELKKDIALISKSNELEKIDLVEALATIINTLDKIQKSTEKKKIVRKKAEVNDLDEIVETAESSDSPAEVVAPVIKPKIKTKSAWFKESWDTNESFRNVYNKNADVITILSSPEVIKMKSPTKARHTKESSLITALSKNNAVIGKMINDGYEQFTAQFK